MKAKRLALVALACLAMAVYAGSASAQVDLSGNWAPADSPDQLNQATGPYPTNFVGIPLNQAGREQGATADASDEQDELNRQCATWSAQYFVEGPFPIEIRPLTDRLDAADVLAWILSGTPDRQPEVIWMDGRPQPPALARHTWAGFATGTWRGDTLDVSITHMKDNWMTRNDAPESNQETVSMFLSREQDLLTFTFIIHDPVYLGAPYVRARTFRYNTVSPTAALPTRNDCLPSEVISGLSDGYHAARYLPGKNPDLTYMLKNYGIPTQVALGGTDEIYPQFRQVLRKEYTRPSGYCTIDCCAAQGIRGTQCPAPPKAAGAPGAPADSASRDH